MLLVYWPVQNISNSTLLWILVALKSAQDITVSALCCMKSQQNNSKKNNTYIHPLLSLSCHHLEKGTHACDQRQERQDWNLTNSRGISGCLSMLEYLGL